MLGELKKLFSFVLSREQADKYFAMVKKYTEDESIFPSEAKVDNDS